MRIKFALLVPLVLSCVCPAGFTQGLVQLDTNCIVSILNRSARVRADGTWHIDNVPANLGLVRVRATCVKDGITLSGQSDFINLEANIDNGFSPFPLGNASAIPSTLTIAVPSSPLIVSNAIAQLTVTATYPDGTTRNITAATNGTSYTVSNPTFVSITPDGLVTAKRSGVVIVSAINDGAIGFGRVSVILSGVDSDGDGIPDDIELANGLDPHNPADAEEDPDGDGLTNFQELMIYGTNPRLADTDGDGISDGDEVSGRLGFVTNPLLADSDGDGINDLLEIQTGSNPNDRTSFNLARALQSFEVTPPAFVLTVNTIIGEASRQLSVIGHLKDGTTIDLSSTARGTVYSSDNLFVANFGAPDGNVFAGTNGTATITVSNSTFVATVAVTVRSSTPQTLGFVSIPGFANSVAVSGNYAYVAAGAAGLQVVDVTDRSNPRVVAALDTSGNANDVKVVGNLVYVADGSAGLRIISVTNPLVPVLVGTVDTPGDARHVFVSGNYAYVADGPGGFKVIDVAVAASPRIIGSADTLGEAQGLDVAGTIVVVAEGPAGVQLLDVTDPANPVIQGALSYGGNARGVAIQGNYLFVADYSRSLTVIDMTDRRNLKLGQSTPQNTGGLLTDVVIAGRFALGADVFFVNGIPIFDIGIPTNPIPRAILDFRAIRDDNGTGIAADNSYAYLTAVQGLPDGKGTTGDSRLYIGQYLAIEDTRGVPPVVQILSPANNTSFIEGQTITVRVDASDDVGVAAVNLLVNGSSVGVDTLAPYEFPFTIPSGVASVMLQARAVDYAANSTLSSNVLLRVIPDPLTTVVGRVVDEATNGVGGVMVKVFATYLAVTAPDGTFSIPGVPTIRGNFIVVATTTITNVAFNGSTRAFAPNPGASVDVGDVLIRPVQNQGKEFMVVFERNYDNSGPTLTLFISSEESTLGTVEIPGLLFSTNFSVLPGTVTSVIVPAAAVVTTQDGTAKLGIRIAADRPISVYGLNRIPFTSDAFTGLPVETFGTRYRTMCYTHTIGGGSGQSQFAVVAVEDNTTVTITPRASAGVRVANQPFQVVLQRFDVYQLGTTQNGTDLTGSLIVSDKPVGVFSGNACANVPTGVFACDHLCEQMPPTDTWGTQAFTVPLATRLRGDTFRILADAADTEVQIIGPNPETFTLGAGSFAERILTGSSVIIANKPILVAQFSNGTSYDGVTSDPFMMLVPSSDQFLASYTFATPATGFSVNYVNVVATSDDVAGNGVLLDGTSIPQSEFSPIGTTGYSGARLAISKGTHSIRGAHPVGIYVYGFDNADSYGYPGGLALRRQGRQPAGVAIVSVSPINERTLQLRVHADSAQLYRIEFSTDLVNWMPMETSVSASGTLTVTNEPAPASRFYRAVRR